MGEGSDIVEVSVGVAFVGLFLCIALMLNGCSLSYTRDTGWTSGERSVSLQEILDTAKFCYITRHGLTVKAHKSACPSRAVVEAETEQLLRWAIDDGEASVLQGHEVIVTPYQLADCVDGTPREGCNVGNTSYVRSISLLPTVLKHELYHEVLARTTGSMDAQHFLPLWEWRGI